MKFFVVILIAAAAFYFYKSDQPELIIYDGLTSENIFEVSGSDSRFQYELEEGFIAIDAVAAMTGTNGGLKEGGALLTVHLLNHQAVNKFTETYGQSGLCPAPFFNQYADQKILVAANSVIGEQIASWNLPDYRMSSTWEKFTIQGQCIKRLKYGELDGEEMQIPDSFFNNCRMILVNELEHYSL